MKKAILSAILATGILSLGFVISSAQTESEGGPERIRVLKSVEVFKDLLTLPEKGIPPALLRKAQAVAIIPGFLKGMMTKTFWERQARHMLEDFKALAEAKVPVPA